MAARGPALVADLPAGGTGYLQAANGYRYTIVAGEVPRKDDQFTGARPGRRVRSTQFEAGRKLAAE
jgi:N-acyl-D-aspartate/D-glutamate deacylase